MIKSLLQTIVLFLLPLNLAFSQYAEWRYHGKLVLLTTPDGANLPETAYEEGFPVLVRLTKETFDFSQVMAEGKDLRFSLDGKPLAYQIEKWDATAGEADIWVRIPAIRGNTRLEVTLHWGKSDAVSESNGRTVFNRSNGFAVVMHLGNTDHLINDEVGTISPTNNGTTSCTCAIGDGRRFDVGKGISCGEKIVGLPVGSGPCTTEAWIKANNVNGIAIGWGNEQAQGKVVMGVRSPPHVNMDCYFSSANVASRGRLPMSEWVHVAHTYREGDSRLFVNGQLAGHSTGRQSLLNIRNPARMWLGGWYNNFRFVGEMDEVRISNVARSDDWIKLSYENQKPNQTLVGTLAQSGDAFVVTPAVITLDEGQRVTVTARAGGAEKVYWILHRDGSESVVATDRFTYTFDAGRVTNDTSCLLRFKAIFPSEVKFKDVPVTIKNAIPEPKYTLDTPSTWNGRDAIEIVPRITNLAAMKAVGAAELRYRWTVSGGAVSKQVATDRLILKRSQFTGPIRVTAAIDNGGTESAETVTIQVTEPSKDPWVYRSPDEDEKPEEGQFFARDDKNEGTLHYNGTLDAPAESVFLKLYAGEKLLWSESRNLGADKKYAFLVKLSPALVKYRIEFGAKISGKEELLDKVGNLVCGDAYLIDGQSNALATDTREDSPRDINEWIRSYGGPTGRSDGNVWVRTHQGEAEKSGLRKPNLWCSPVWKANQKEHKAEIGWWGMELAKRLVVRQKVPICIINTAVGGTRIDEHQPNTSDRNDLYTMYGRMRWRLQQSRLSHGIRGVVWHQGENDQGSDGPTGGYGWETYQQYFVDMSAAWKEDMPNLRYYYIFQIWPNSCAMGGLQGSGDRLRETQRTLPRLYSNMRIMSTLGIHPPGPCHYPLEGWSEFARLIEPMIEQDFYNKVPLHPISPPDLRQARFTSEAKDEINLEFDQHVVWHDSLASQFYLDDKAGVVINGSGKGSTITLKLKGASSATKISYLKERDWSQSRLILGVNGIAALTFCDVVIGPPTGL